MKHTTAPSLGPENSIAASERVMDDGPWLWANKDALRHLNETFGDSGILSSARGVYLALCEIASDRQSGTFETTEAAIGSRAGYERKWIGKVVAHLEQAGLISVRRRTTASGLSLPSIYTLLARRIGTSPVSPEFAPVGTQRDGTGCTPRPAFTSHVRRNPRNERNRRNPTPPASPPRCVRAGEGGEDFCQFWDAYPRKCSKADAERAWVQMGCRAHAALIMTTLARATLCAEWRKDGGQFIPHPATWLNGRRWEDDYHPAAPPTLKLTL